jgi:hypothetical protein
MGGAWEVGVCYETWGYRKVQGGVKPLGVRFELTVYIYMHIINRLTKHAVSAFM